MVQRGMIYEHWMALTPNEQWQSYLEIEAELHRLQDIRAKEVRVTLAMDGKDARRLFVSVLDDLVGKGAS